MHPASRSEQSNKQPHVPLWRSLSFRQARTSVLVAFFIGLVLSSAQIYLDYFSHRSDVEISVTSVLSTANRAAYHAAFNLDEMGATQITRGLVSNAPMVTAAIIDQDGNVLGAATRAEPVAVSPAARWAFGEPREIRRELLNMQQHSQTVGVLSVVIDPALTASSFVQRAKVVFLSGILRNFVLALCLIGVFYFTTTRPILRASAPIQQGIKDRRIPLPLNHQDDEIGVLLNAFNEHLATIEEQHELITQANANLEELVKKRTLQLEDKNTELSREREIALRASQAKSDFLAMMSHEIRTPMQGILGMAELLAEAADSPDTREYVDALTDSGRSLLTLINSVLDYAKYEQGKLEFESIAFDLSRLLNGIVFLLSPTAETKGLNLLLDVGSSVPRIVCGDPEKLRQVLLNLLGNAIKFTDAGLVKLQVTAHTQTRSDMVTLDFSVTDTGPGIPESAQVHIFEAFSQGDSSIARRFGGSGLGLSICRQIIETQGGQIGCKNLETTGTMFWFRLDLKQADSDTVHADSSPPAPVQALAPARVLIVDDVAINRKLFAGQLKNSGMQTHEAANGEAALQQIAAQVIDAVLMDVQMPIMDGMEASRRIRALADRRQAGIPILGITANLTLEKERECRAAGMDRLLVKPVTSADLMAALKALLAPVCEHSPEHARSALSSETAATPEDSLLRPEVFHEHEDTLGSDQVKALYRQAAEQLTLRHRALEQWKQVPGSASKISDEAHAMAGLCGLYGFARLGALCCELENRPNGIGDSDTLPGDTMAVTVDATLAAISAQIEAV